jgi:hypothetical protein
MSSPPFISHRLFVAAIKEDTESLPKRARGKAVIDLPQLTHPGPGERPNGRSPGPDPATGGWPVRAGTFGL